MHSNGDMLLLGMMLFAVSSRALSSSTSEPRDLTKLNVTELKRERLAATCADIAHEDGSREVSLFEDVKRTEHDCCLLQFEDECLRSFCGSKEALLDGLTCDYLGKRVHTYQDNLFACTQSSSGRPCADLVHTRSASDEPSSGGGSGMPIWLIILLVVLIIVGIVMIIIVVRLFNEDKDQKKVSSRSRASNKQSSRRNSSRK